MRTFSLGCRGLLFFAVLACNLGKTKNSNSNMQTRTQKSDQERPQRNVHGQRRRRTAANTAARLRRADHTIHLRATLKEAKSGTEMKFSWWIVDADGPGQEDQRHRLHDEGIGKRYSRPLDSGRRLAKGKIQSSGLRQRQFDKTADYIRSSD